MSAKSGVGRVFPGVHNRHPSRVRDPGLYHIRDLDRPNLDVVRRVAAWWTITIIVVILNLNTQAVISCMGRSRNSGRDGGKCGKSKKSFFITVIL